MEGPSDVVVIGGGVIGVSTAWALVERGARVRLVERGEICSGCSYGNAGWIFPSHSAPLAAPGAIGQALRWLLDARGPFYVKPRASAGLVRWLWQFRAACTTERAHRAFRINRELSLASRDRYAQLAALPGLEFGYAQRGLVIACRTREALDETSAELRLLQALGGEGERLGAEELRRRAPALAGDLAGGAYLSADAHVTPDAFVLGLARECGARGVEVATGEEVIALERAAGRVHRVVTTRRELAADHVVLAAGAWSPALAAPLGLRLPIEPAKGYSVSYERPDGFGDAPVMLAEARVGVTPMGARLRAAGTLELAGLDLGIRRPRVDAIEAAVRRYLPGAAPLRRVETWRGLRPLTPDSLPLIGPAPRLRNLWLATGHGMSGVSQGPITGELIAQLVSGETPSIDVAPLAPSRFA